MYVVSTVNEYNDYNLVDVSGRICVYDIQSTTCITLTTLFPLSHPQH